MAGLLSLYIALHSPVQSLLPAFLGPGRHGCSLTCIDSQIRGRFAPLVSPLVLILAALLAAWVMTAVFDGPAYERPLAFGLSALGFVVVPAGAISGIAEWTGTA